MDHQGIITWDDGVVMMMTLLGAEPHVAERQVRETKGSYAKIIWRTFWKSMWRVWMITLRRRIWWKLTSSRTLPLGCTRSLDCWTIFVDAIKNNVPLTYLKYFVDLVMVADYV
jgi:hypothetical protein